MNSTSLGYGSFFVLVATAFASGCLKSEVIDEANLSSGGQSPAGGGGTRPIDPLHEGVAMRWDAIPSDPVESGTVVSSSSGGGPAGDSLYVTFGRNVAFTCGTSPFAPFACPGWSVGFTLPVELQHPGSISLDDPRINATSSESFPNEGVADASCYFGGGSFFDGKLEILSFDDGFLTFRIDGAPVFAFDANGEHQVPICN